MNRKKKITEIYPKGVSYKQRQATMRQSEGHNHNNIKPHTLWVSGPQMESNYTMETLPQEWNWSAPNQGLQSEVIARGRGFERTSSERENLVLKAKSVWLQETHGIWTKTTFLEGTHKVLWSPQPKRKKMQWPHKRLGQSYPLVLEGLLWSQGVANSSLGQRHWQQ